MPYDKVYDKMYDRLNTTKCRIFYLIRWKKHIYCMNIDFTFSPIFRKSTGMANACTHTIKKVTLIASPPLGGHAVCVTFFLLAAAGYNNFKKIIMCSEKL